MLIVVERRAIPQSVKHFHLTRLHDIFQKPKGGDRRLIALVHSGSQTRRPRKFLDDQETLVNVGE